MGINFGLLIVVGVLAACGAYLLMERSLVRMLLGLLLCGNAINLLIIVVSGGVGHPPIMGRSSEASAGDADPLGQAMVLTAIVITMGVAGFVLSLVYRLFVLNRDDDDVEDDSEDLRILSRSLQTAPDRDRSDDPVTGADTSAGDLFDDAGNPLTAEQYTELHRALIETDLMPEDADVIEEDVIDEPGGDSTPDPDPSSDNTAPDPGSDTAPDPGDNTAPDPGSDNAPDPGDQPDPPHRQPEQDGS